MRRETPAPGAAGPADDAAVTHEAGAGAGADDAPVMHEAGAGTKAGRGRPAG